jgi:hypothetical protein
MFKQGITKPQSLNFQKVLFHRLISITSETLGPLDTMSIPLDMAFALQVVNANLSAKQKKPTRRSLITFLTRR